MFYTNTDLFSQGFEAQRSKSSIVGGNQGVIRMVHPLKTPGQESGPGLFWLLGPVAFLGSGLHNSDLSDHVGFFSPAGVKPPSISTLCKDTCDCNEGSPGII